MCICKAAEGEDREEDHDGRDDDGRTRGKACTESWSCCCCQVPLPTLSDPCLGVFVKSRLRFLSFSSTSAAGRELRSGKLRLGVGDGIRTTPACAVVCWFPPPTSPLYVCSPRSGGQPGRGAATRANQQRRARRPGDSPAPPRSLPVAGCRLHPSHVAFQTSPQMLSLAPGVSTRRTKHNHPGTVADRP